MIDIQLADSQEDPPDHIMVENLVRAAMNAMQRASIPDITTSAELLSASFTILDRFLMAAKKMQHPDDRAENTKEIARVLSDFMVDYGQLPN